MLLSTPHGALLTKSPPIRSPLALRCIFPSFTPLHVTRRLSIGGTVHEPVQVVSEPHVESRRSVTCLPNEILNVIMEDVSKQDLTYIVRVCQRLYSVGVRVLYGRISLVDIITLDVMGNPNSLVAASQCCSTLVRRPQLAGLVHRLRIELQPSPATTTWKLPNSIIAPIGTMLRQLSKLTHLELRVLGASLTDILFDCPFSLKYFSCDTCDPRPLHGFLVLQSSLTELHLVGPTQPVGSFFLDHRYGRNLRKVSGTLDLVASVVPGRPVEEVKIVDAFLNTEMIRTRIHLLKTSAATIKVFRVVTVICQSSMIEVIAENLPGIEVLGLHILAPSDRHIPYVNLLDSIAPIVAMLPRLRHLDACGNDEYEHAHWLEHLSKEQMLLNLWGELSLTLERVRFPTGAEWARQRNGTWTHVHAIPVMYEVESRRE